MKTGLFYLEVVVSAIITGVGFVLLGLASLFSPLYLLFLLFSHLLGTPKRSADKILKSSRQS